LIYAEYVTSARKKGKSRSTSLAMYGESDEEEEEDEVVDEEAAQVESKRIEDVCSFLYKFLCTPLFTCSR
jgi:hypothetical protein